MKVFSAQKYINSAPELVANHEMEEYILELDGKPAEQQALIKDLLAITFEDGTTMLSKVSCLTEKKKWQPYRKL